MEKDVPVSQNLTGNDISNISKNSKSIRHMDTRRLVAWAPYILLLLVALVMTIGNRNFLNAINLETLAVQVSALLVLAIGTTFIVLMGSIDISFAEMANLVSVIIAMTIGRFGYLSFGIGILVGALAGLGNGLLFVKGRIPSMVATLGTMGFFTGMAYIISGGPPVQIQQYSQYLSWVTGTTFGLPNETLIALIATLIAGFILRFTWYGRTVYAIGAGEQVAKLSGLHVGRIKIITFVIAGVYYAIGAIIMAARIKAGSPVLASGYLLYVLAAIVVGGTALSGGVGGVVRTVIGALIITMLRNGMNVVGVDAFAQQVVVGVVLIVAVAVTIDRSKIAVMK
jgi:ribose transport system permease protein